jgi:hypothetical protein
MSGVIPMRRWLVFVLAVVIAGSAMAAPAYACVPTHESVKAKPHSCCETAMVVAPVGPCCIVTAQVQRLSSTETRVAAPDQSPAIARAADALSWSGRDRGSSVPPPTVRPSPVPLYLQQLSLLI